MSYNKLPIIPEELELNKNDRPVNSNGKRLKINKTGQLVYNNKGKPVYNNGISIQLPKKINNTGQVVYNNNGNPVYSNNGNNNKLPKKIKIQIHPVSKFSYIIEKNGEVEKKIKLDSKGYPEKYSNGRPVILGEHGYAVNNKGQILTFDQRTGDLIRNENGNPYVYNPHPGGFKIHKIKYRYPQFTNTQKQYINNPSISFLNGQGPGQKQVPTVLGSQPEYIPGGFKVNKTPPKSVFEFNKRRPGNNESNTAPLLQNPGNLKNNSALSKLFGKLSFRKKDK